MTQDLRIPLPRINFSDRIRAQGRDLYLQTNTLEAGEQIVSALYDGGRILIKESLSYDPDISEVELESNIKEWHNRSLSSIEMLYSLSVRVKTVRHPPSLIRLGRQFLRWSLLDEAIEELTLALQYDPKAGDAYCLLGKAYTARGSFREAVETLKTGCRAFENYADLWQQLGRAYLEEKQIKEAAGAIQKALKLNRGYDEAHISMAVCYLHRLAGKKGKPAPEDNISRARIKEHLNRAAASIRFQTHDFEEAVRTFHKGDSPAALSILEDVLRHLPPMIDLDFMDYFYLNYMYGEGRQPKDIQIFIEKLELLSKRYPRFPDLRNHLGIGYLLQCRTLFQKALQQFRSAAEIDPQYERVRKNLKLTENDSKGLLILLRALLK